MISAFHEGLPPERGDIKLLPGTSPKSNSAQGLASMQVLYASGNSSW